VDRSHDRWRQQLLLAQDASGNLKATEDKVKYFRLDDATYDENWRNSKPTPKPARLPKEYQFESPLHRHRYLLDPTLRLPRNESNPTLVAGTTETAPKRSVGARNAARQNNEVGGSAVSRHAAASSTDQGVDTGS
jgi:hypothetical protein